jgi:hypothetical protein
MIRSRRRTGSRLRPRHHAQRLSSGLSASLCEQYMHFIANRRCVRSVSTQSSDPPKILSPGCPKRWTSRRRKTSSRPASSSTRTAARWAGSSDSQHNFPMHASRKTPPTQWVLVEEERVRGCDMSVAFLLNAIASSDSSPDKHFRRFVTRYAKLQSACRSRVLLG